MNYRRLAFLVAALVVIAFGLLWRRPELGLPSSVSKYGGSTLWGAMVFCCLAALMPRRGLGVVAPTAAILAALVEFSQLIQIEWLDQFRRTTFGALLLGRTFSWWDIPWYWVGIGAAAWLAAIAVAQARTPLHHQ